jgi:integrase/recombinase XerD
VLSIPFSKKGKEANMNELVQDHQLELYVQLKESLSAFYEQLINRWLAESDLRPETKRSYRRWVNYFIDWIEFNNIEKPEHKDVVRYKEELRILGRSGHTISCYLIAVRQFFDWLEFKGLYKNVAKRVKTEKRSAKHKRDALTKEQALKVLSLIRNVRDRALYLLLLTTGLRLCEVNRALVGDIRNNGERTVLWVQGKGHSSKDEYVILEGITFEAMRKYLNSRKAKANEPLFTTTSSNYNGWRLGIKSMSSIIRRYMVMAGVKTDKLCAHSLRHTAVTFALLGGATLQEGQMLARHSDVNTTMIYAHNLDRLSAKPERKVLEYLGI